MLLWRGVEFPLLSDSDSARIWRDEQGFHLPPGIDEENLKFNVIRLYKICAKNYLIERVRHFAKMMRVNPSDVKVTEAKTRWGSCSKRMLKTADNASLYSSPAITRALKMNAAKKDPVYNVNFSWRLCMAEDDVIDAVVVHELAHIKEMNHSPAFYAEVKAVLPDYDERNAKLKLLSRRLGCEDWEM
jgi:predicted metal-dependent hydrolase